MSEEGLNRVRSRIKVADAMGVSVMTVSSGEGKDDEELKKLYANLTAIGDYAAERDIVLAFETHPGATESGPRMAKTMRDLNHPNLRLNFDTANVMFYNDGADPLEHFEMVMEWVAHVHLKDSRGR